MDWELARYLIALTMLKSGYDASKSPQPFELETCQDKLTASSADDTVRVEPPELPPRLRKWANKSAQNYARAQERKWRNWEQAMFELKPKA
ncbi:MAG: hypothetical protein PHQ43_09525 [Dehalococcoidales bacterium]|nr:hypothetical protein [Dehalococcoidales bacterium]